MIILKWQQVRFQNDEDNKMTILKNVQKRQVTIVKNAVQR